jgi:hypothetical protein
MRGVDSCALGKLASFTSAELSTPCDPPEKHDPAKLAKAVSCVFFREYLDSDFFLFDYDDTLVDRDGRLPRSSKSNIEGISRLNELTKTAICTGNKIGALNLRGEHSGAREPIGQIEKPLMIFADGGVNLYSYGDTIPMNGSGNHAAPPLCICPAAQFPTEGPYSANAIVEALRRAGIFDSTIDVRGNVIIAIKPVPQEYRNTVLRVTQHIVNGSDLEVRECGRTTIEICRSTVSKKHALIHLLAASIAGARITYVGDEFQSGNDRDVEAFAGQNVGVCCLQVGGPTKTAFFIRTLIEYLTKNVAH